MNTAEVVVRTDGNCALRDHGARIEPFIHLHDRHAGFAIARQQSALDGRRAAPARQ